MTECSYSQVKKHRFERMAEASKDHFQLNALHDNIYKRVIQLAIENVSKEYGPPPCSFSFFVTGSAGRLEQSIWSDQDHGLIYHHPDLDMKSYFLILGKEISKGLYQVGYPYCDGGVMSSNPMWCKSISEWEVQLNRWIEESSWESIRYLLIFLDARILYGTDNDVHLLKNLIFQKVNTNQLMNKFLNNTMFYKKGINVLGMLLPETHGQHAGALNIKEIGLFPYVNALRLIAIKEKMSETSTLLRLESISETMSSVIDKPLYTKQFLKLLNYRLLLCDQTDYDSGHYLSLKRLTKEQTKDVKDMIKHGAALFAVVRKLLEKEDSYGAK
ncbi:DUF294 nucleotidyltransferase-like domain-containing protein [Neobacillus dielmonensis]|uniref:DUF294 nucleotidyltransferase-like domain-containing protein n=1 Tax=Neobacillus dielmonensis TaxID=1347369 RepID=UPI0005A94245|nr:DUF294 nucleotidyltransferase-like domain-containing protein [Neobacillus dielmonensis]